MAINRAQLAKELEPGLNALFGMEYSRYENEHAEIFDQESSDRAFEEEVMLMGFGEAGVKQEGAGPSAVHVKPKIKPLTSLPSTLRPTTCVTARERVFWFRRRAARSSLFWMLLFTAAASSLSRLSCLQCNFLSTALLPREIET